MINNSSHSRLGDLISAISNGRIVLRPPFQRRNNIWTSVDKEYLIDTVLKSYPFPEIFTSDGEKIDNGPERKKWIVDGQQRLTILSEYRLGTSTVLYTNVPRFIDLSTEQQDAFDSYTVATRQLGLVSEKQIEEVFLRINATDYQLKSMEKLNAIFHGKLQQLCLKLSQHTFFAAHGVFKPADYRRMNDISYCVSIVVTILGGYYHRTSENEKYLRMYDESFAQEYEILNGLEKCFQIIDGCKFPKKFRVWRQVDLFTLLVELYTCIVVKRHNVKIDCLSVSLIEFYHKVDALFDKGNEKINEFGANDEGITKYYKASSKAPGDKFSRIDRSEVIEGIIKKCV